MLALNVKKLAIFAHTITFMRQHFWSIEDFWMSYQEGDMAITLKRTHVVTTHRQHENGCTLNADGGIKVAFA